MTLLRALAKARLAYVAAFLVVAAPLVAGAGEMVLAAEDAAMVDVQGTWVDDMDEIRAAEEAASAADAAQLALVLDLDRITTVGPTYAEAEAILELFDMPEPTLLPLEDAWAAARSDTKDKPILLVHGRDSYDMAGWANMRTYLINTYGFTGGVHRVGYYGGECNVEYRAEHHGSHDAAFGGSGEHSSKTGCNGVAGAQVHDLGTDIRHIAYHYAWMIRDHFNDAGKPVDVIAHSMGGLLTRYMLAKELVDGFPSLAVEDVTTMGTPHGGLSSWCSLSPWADVRQMCASSSFIDWLRTNAQNVQSRERTTDWTLEASEGTCDGWVTEGQATDMTAGHKVVYQTPCYSHSAYYGDTSNVNDATVDYMNGGAWSRWTAAPHSIRWAAHASYYGSW